MCLNCKFHDRHANRECLESQAEIVKDKEKSNFCDWFDPRVDSAPSNLNESGNPLDKLFSSSSEAKKKTKLEEELEAFFKKK